MSTVTPQRGSTTDAVDSGANVGLQRASVGVIVLLAAALVALAFAPTLMPASYSWVEHGVSESAAQGIDGAWLARLGFIFYGLGVLWLGSLRPSSWGPLATLLHLVFGVSMFGVAAFAAKPWEENAAYVESEDVLHSIFAFAMGFAFIVGLVTLIVVRRHRSVWAAIPDWIALVVAATVPLAMSTNIWGLLQRTMFLTTAVWYGRESWLAGQSAHRKEVGSKAEAAAL